MGLTRKELLGLSAGAATSAALRSSPSMARAQPLQSSARSLLFRRADVLTMDEQGELSGVDVLVRDGRIAAIGKRIAAMDAEVVEAAGMILMPGMIDTHRHVWESLECGHIVKLDPSGGRDYQNYKAQAMVCMTPEDFYLSQYFGGLMALDAGVTTVVDYAHVHYTMDRAVEAVRGLQASGVSGTFCYQLGHNPTHRPGEPLSRRRATAERVAPPTEENYRVARYLKENMFPSGGLLDFGLATSYGLGVRPMDEMRVEFERARRLEPRLFATHVHRQPENLAPNLFRSVADLGRAGLLGPDLQVVHGVEMTDAELAMLRDAGSVVSATVLGEMVYPKASITPKARAMGIAVGIGQDASIGVTSNYFEVVRAAFWNMFRLPEYAKIADGYTSTMVLDFVAGLGAKAARYDDRGTIAVGKYADLVLIRTDRMGFAPFGSLADRVANFALLEDVDSVWVRGVARKRAGKLLGVDWPSLRQRVVAAGERIQRGVESIPLVD